MRSARALLLLLVACGAPVALEPPNTVQACEHAAECGVLADVPACVTCLEHVDPKLLPLVEALPPLETVDCATLAAAVRATNLPECVAEKWDNWR
jgi:hypothetical protein